MKQTNQLSQIRQFLLYISISLFSVCALMGIMATLSGPVDWRILTTTLFTAVASLFAMGGVARLEDEQRLIKTLSVVSLIVNALWLLGALILVWELLPSLGICNTSASYEFPEGYDYMFCGRLKETLLKLTITAFIITSLTTLIAKFLSFKRNDSIISGLVTLTISSASLLSLVGLSILWQKHGGDVLTANWQLLTIFGILTVFGLVVTPVLMRAQAYKQKAQAVSDEERQRLRQEIEQEVRAELVAEQQSDKPEDNKDGAE
jgi:membrane protein